MRKTSKGRGKGSDVINMEESGNNTNNNAAVACSQFEVSVGELQRLMESRGPAAIKFLKERYGGVQGLCKKLKTSTHEGKLLCESI